MINFRTEFEFKEQSISGCTVILSPNRLREGPVVVGSAEHTRRLLLGHRHALWLNLQQALVNNHIIEQVSTNTLDEKHYSLLYFS